MADVSLPKFQIKKASAQGEPKSMLIYGPPKKGKTVFAASICQVSGYERVLIIDVEGGASAVSVHFPNVDVVETPTAKDFTEFVNALLNGEVVEPESGLPYQAVIIDTLDKAQSRQLAIFDRETPVVNGKKDGYYKWALIKTWTEKMVDLFHMAPFLTIFVAHQDDDKDEVTGAITTTIMLGGKSKMTVPATPDVIGHFTAKQVKEDGGKRMARVVDFSLNDKLISGQRYGDKLNGQVIDPTMTKVFEAIRK